MVREMGLSLALNHCDGCATQTKRGKTQVSPVPLQDELVSSMLEAFRESLTAPAVPWPLFGVPLNAMISGGRFPLTGTEGILVPIPPFSANIFLESPRCFTRPW